MLYRNIRLTVAVVSALTTLLATLAIGVIFAASAALIFMMPIIAIGCALLVFFVTQSLVGLLFQPLSEMLARVQRLGDGDFSVRFADLENPNKRNPLEVQQLAMRLDKVGNRVRSTMAELMAESRRQSQFISDVSHEIRTPLTAIRGAAETILDEDMPYEDRARFCVSIIRESERLTRLAADLITLQRIEGDGEIVLKRVNLHNVAQAVVDIMKSLFDERDVQVTLSGEAPDVLADPDRLQQVVVNLVDNATRYVGEGGHVHVELSGIREFSVITVSDDGPGFGDIDPARLFDRFYRGDRSRARTTGGTGLGLTIVKSIVTALEGTVEAVNLPGGGACFIVAIPSLPPNSN
ncbi:MAG: HAMP domain-containing histidine kinase [Actinomycetia bacterium]|nr:HAMP domain-containing histidine kinase [Actinomycetes bacterium]